MTQPAKLETSVNPVSEGQEKSRRTSIESPKAAQPSCLSEGFICLFRKRTERNNSLEDHPITDQNTEDKHEAKGKKRKVLGGRTFWLPCLTPAETTGREQNNRQMDKTDEHVNQTVPEEVLKPYSKASFLRRIRGYRLMKEKDASGKEKVLDMNASKEGPLVEEHQLQVDGNSSEPECQENMLGENGKVFIQNAKLEENSNHVVKQEDTWVKTQTNGFKELDPENRIGEVNTVHEKEASEENKDGKKDKIREHENQVDKVEKLENEQLNQKNDVTGQKDMPESHTKLSDNEVSDQGQQPGRVLEPENGMTDKEVNKPKIEKSANGKSEHDEDKEIHKGKAQITAKASTGQEMTVKGVANTAKVSDNPTVKNIQANNVELSELSGQKIYTDKVGEEKHVLLDQACYVEVHGDLRSSCVAKDAKNKRDTMETAAQHCLEDEQREKVEAVVNYEKGKVPRDHFLEEGNESEKKLQDQTQKSQIDKFGDTIERPTEHRSYAGKEGKMEHNALKQNSQKEPEINCVDGNQLENIREKKAELLQQCMENVEPSRKILQFCTEPCGGDQLRDHCTEHKKEQRVQLLTQYNENNEEPSGQFQGKCMDTAGEPIAQSPKQFTEHDGEPGVHLLGWRTDHGREPSDQIQELCMEEEPGELLPKKPTQHEREPRTQKLEEGETRDSCIEEIMELIKVISEEEDDKSFKMFTHTICPTMSDESHVPLIQDTLCVNLKTNQVDKNDVNNTVTECKDAEWESLQVEVKGMVQWLVEEASDKLTCFTQECHSTE